MKQYIALLRKLFKRVFAGNILKLTLIFILLYAVVSMLFPKVLFNADPVTSRDALLINAQILATIFAITVSFTLLGFQFLSQAYTTRLLKEFIKDKVLWFFLLIYPSTILLNIFAASFPLVLSPQTLVFYSFILLSYCLGVLVVYVFHLTKKLQPEIIIFDIGQEMTEDFLDHIASEPFGPRIIGKKDEPAIAFEQFTIKSIENNDFFSYLKGLRLLSDITEGFMKKISIESDSEKKSFRLQAFVLYFLRFLEQIQNEAFSRGREEFLTYLCDYLLELTRQLWEAKSTRAIADVYGVFESIWLKGVENRLRLLLDRFSYFLHRLIEIELKILKEKAFIDLSPEEHAKLTANERNEIAVNEILLENLHWRRPRFLKEICILASEKKLNEIVRAVNSSFSDMLDAVLKIESENKKRWLTYIIVNAMKEAHFKSVDNGISETTFTTGMLHYKIESIVDPNLLKTQGKWITEQFCRMSLYSIEKGYYYGEILFLGINGRYLVLKYPEVADVIVDALGKSLEITSKYADENKEIATDLIIKELKSLEHWNNHPHEEITKKIQKLLQRTSTSN